MRSPCRPRAWRNDTAILHRQVGQTRRHRQACLCAQRGAGSETKLVVSRRPGICATITTVKPSTALDLQRAAVQAAATRYRAANPRVFGSVVHGRDIDGSDLDLLVDALPGTTLFDLGGLQVELEELLGVQVDLLTPGDLPAKFRDQVLAEARPV